MAIVLSLTLLFAVIVLHPAHVVAADFTLPIRLLDPSDAGEALDLTRFSRPCRELYKVEGLAFPDAAASILCVVDVIDTLNGPDSPVPRPTNWCDLHTRAGLKGVCDMAFAARIPTGEAPGSDTVPERPSPEPGIGRRLVPYGEERVVVILKGDNGRTRLLRTHRELEQSGATVTAPEGALWMLALKNATRRLPSRFLATSADVEATPAGWRITRMAIGSSVCANRESGVFAVARDGSVRVTREKAISVGNPACAFETAIGGLGIRSGDGGGRDTPVTARLCTRRDIVKSSPSPHRGEESTRYLGERFVGNASRARRSELIVADGDGPGRVLRRVPDIAAAGLVPMSAEGAAALLFLKGRFWNGRRAYGTFADLNCRTEVDAAAARIRTREDLLLPADRAPPPRKGWTFRRPDRLGIWPKRPFHDLGVLADGTVGQANGFVSARDVGEERLFPCARFDGRDSTNLWRTSRAEKIDGIAIAGVSALWSCGAVLPWGMEKKVAPVPFEIGMAETPLMSGAHYRAVGLRDACTGTVRFVADLATFEALSPKPTSVIGAGWLLGLRNQTGRIPTMAAPFEGTVTEDDTGWLIQDVRLLAQNCGPTVKRTFRVERSGESTIVSDRDPQSGPCVD